MKRIRYKDPEDVIRQCMISLGENHISDATSDYSRQVLQKIRNDFAPYFERNGWDSLSDEQQEIVLRRMFEAIYGMPLDRVQKKVMDRYE